MYYMPLAGEHSGTFNRYRASPVFSGVGGHPPGAKRRINLKVCSDRKCFCKFVCHSCGQVNAKTRLGAISHWETQMTQSELHDVTSIASMRHRAN